MIRWPTVIWTLLSASCVILAGARPIAAEQTPAAGAASLPAHYRATVMILNAPKMGMAQLRFTIERWTTDDEKNTLLEALKTGSTMGLAEAMETMEAGYVQVDSNLRYPVRVASTWRSDKGQVVRLATNRPIEFAEFRSGSRSMDYPIGIVEFTVPSEGRGDGTLLAATQAGFDSQGRIEVRSLPGNTGPQRLANVERESPRKSTNN